MSKLVTDYIKVYREYTQDQLDLIVETSSDFNWSPHQWGSYKQIDGSRKETELDVSYAPNVITQLVVEKSITSCEKYTLEFDNLFHINDISPPRFNRYTENTNMKNHIDHIHALFDGKNKGIPVLSIVTVFNDDYSGGDFIFNDDYNVELSAGDTLIFPSVFLFKHKVNTVTQGVRLSAVSWTW